MRNAFTTAALTLTLAAAPASGAEVTGDYPACGKPFWLEAMLEFQANGQEDHYNRWINQQRCIQLREGLEVEVIRYYGDAGNKRVELEINGFRFFTVRKAIAQPL